MDRRAFLKAAGAGLLSPFLATPAPGSSSVEPSERPNILVVVLDDARDDMMPFMERTNAGFSQGTAFDNAHAVTAVCGPARSALFTGRYPSQTNLWHNKGNAQKFRRDGRALESYPYVLNTTARYNTGLFGKFLNDYDSIAGWVPRGWNTWLCTLLDRAPVMANANGKIRKVRRPGSNELVWRTEEAAWITDRFLAWHEKARSDSRPFVASLSLAGPHNPYTPSQAAIDRWNAIGVPLRKTEAFDHPDPNKPGYVRRGPLSAEEKATIEADWTGKMQEMMDIDAQVGRLFDNIDLEDTYVFFLSDQGYQLGEHRLFKKMRPYSETTKIPLRVAGPGIVGGTSSALVSSLDVTATVAELAGVDEAWPEDSPLDGRSLSPLLFGADGDDGVSEWRNSLLIEQAQEYGPIYGAWKAVLSTGGELYVEHPETGEREYYPASDPMQLTNAAGDPERAGEIDALSGRLEGLLGASGEGLRVAEGAT